MSEAKKEQLRAQIAYFNGVAISILAVGGFSTFISLSVQRIQPDWIPYAMVVSSLIVSVLVHKVAALSAWQLGRLMDEEKRLGAPPFEASSSPKVQISEARPIHSDREQSSGAINTRP
ncbi:hypothetical protein G6K83_11210 [Agrobacterium rhizogenes]|uniref:hypothetical protein n=1 Tax=Rhizobium rhizogenes TaxID=359 RepID=UPI001571ECDB|nr:hypothetical protein [Rhizobium rhizogenes]NTH25640.1 hypothetical protein [Rhizobium rhizogenes]